MSGDPRMPALKVRARRAVETLMNEWASRGRPRDVAYDLLTELAIGAAGVLERWAGRMRTREVLWKLSERLQARSGETRFEGPLGLAGAPLPALEQARSMIYRLADERAGTGEVFSATTFKGLAWSLLIAALDDAQRRFGPAGAAAITREALWATEPAARTMPAEPRP